MQLNEIRLEVVRELETKFRVPLITCEAEILLLLAEKEKNAGEMSRKSRRSAASFAQTLSRLLDMEIVTCREDERDRRRVLYSLSSNVAEVGLLGKAEAP